MALNFFARGTYPLFREVMSTLLTSTSKAVNQAYSHQLFHLITWLICFYTPGIHRILTVAEVLYFPKFKVDIAPL